MCFSIDGRDRLSPLALTQSNSQHICVSSLCVDEGGDLGAGYQRVRKWASIRAPMVRGLVRGGTFASEVSTCVYSCKIRNQYAHYVIHVISLKYQ